MNMKMNIEMKMNINRKIMRLQAVYPCFMSILPVNSACQCYKSMLTWSMSRSLLLVHHTCPVYTSVLYVDAACPYVSIFPVHAPSAYPCCSSLLHVHAACPCFLSSSPCYMSILHEHAIFVLYSDTLSKIVFFAFLS